MALRILGEALRILGVAPKVGEKGVALKVGASHLTPLDARGSNGSDNFTYLID